MRQVVTLENPLSEGQSMMRPTLLGSLLDAARHNVSRNGPDVAIFESGTVYRAPAGGPLADEHHALGALITGALLPRSWAAPATRADLFSAKALLAAVLDAVHVEWAVEPSGWPFLHPGRSATVLAGGEALGFLGELHPLVAAEWDLDRTAVFSIDLGRLVAIAPDLVHYVPFGPFPPLRQDLAVTVPDEVPYAEVLAAVRSGGGEALEDVALFDVYAGEQVGEGRRSLALALRFRAADRTLADEDVEPLRERIVAALAAIGGELRG
jgi:phenylalanyl-tRNA synthetase beta chain